MFDFVVGLNSVVGHIIQMVSKGRLCDCLVWGKKKKKNVSSTSNDYFYQIHWKPSQAVK